VALREAINSVREQKPFTIDAWVLLPDHLHSTAWTDSRSCAIRIPHVHVGHAGGRQKTAPAFSAFATFLWLSNAWSSCRAFGPCPKALPIFLAVGV
jgi:hypothetical protein